jgi:hypothetical protein
MRSDGTLAHVKSHELQLRDGCQISVHRADILRVFTLFQEISAGMWEWLAQSELPDHFRLDKLNTP